MTDLSTMIAAKSDQLNADDLLGGPRDIEISKVRGCSEPEQPVAIHYVGDDGKPWKPCKTMRRVLVAAWGPEGKDYVGRRLRLYRDDGVKFGGILVGGIRISHMSHLQGDLAIPVNITRGKKAAYPVKVLPAPRTAAQRAAAESDFPGDRTSGPTPESGAPTQTQGATLDQRSDAYEARITAAPSTVKLKSIQAAAAQLRKDLDAGDPERLAELDNLFNETFATLEEAEKAGE